MRAVSGSCDHTLKHWDLKPGAASPLLATLTGHTDVVSCLALSPQGCVLSGSWDGSIRLWDLGSEQPSGDNDNDNDNDNNKNKNKNKNSSQEVQVQLVFALDAAHPVTCLSVDWGSLRAVTGSERCMKLWDLDLKACTNTWRGHLGTDAGYTEAGMSVSVGHLEAVSCVVMSSCPPIGGGVD
ncbi:unnamed protein product [Polarella glacialis]|uniref:Guanine nucleotide-binding protein subunit beta-like protein n=1 Tax=Polarella glacialis TaxID=89957 RepID=A0A813L6M6_POLGL|nr:unnamed protein product [Polarella glacialis]